jgi:hypothetical protein
MNIYISFRRVVVSSYIDIPQLTVQSTHVLEHYVEQERPSFAG